MAYEAPTQDTLSKQIRAAIRAQVPGAEPALWPNNSYVLAKSLVPMFEGVYKRIEQVHQQSRVPTADTEGLELRGSEIGITRRPAQIASGTATAVTDIGTAIPDGTLFARVDGVTFKTLGAVTATAASTTLDLRAVDAGAAGNTIGAIGLTPVVPIAGLGATTVDDAGLSGGDDVENDASLRARILLRLRSPPQGGSPADYEEWALGMTGVTRVFVQRATPAAGSVTVYFMMDETYSTGVPLTGDIAALTALLESLAPADAHVIVAAPTLQSVNVTITGLSPDTPAIRAAIASEITEMFLRRAQPGDDNGGSFTFSVIWIAEAISAAWPNLSYTLTLPAADVVCAAGHLAVLGTLTFA